MERNVTGCWDQVFPFVGAIVHYLQKNLKDGMTGRRNG